MKKDDGFRQALLDPVAFHRVQARVRNQNLPPSQLPAYHRLLSEAEAALATPRLTVLQKKHLPPSGDKRDYFSLSVYFWPNPATPNGEPYLQKDGQINPAVDEYDRPQFTQLTTQVDTLAIAYALSGDERFAAKAAELLRTWFVNPATRMNPHMLFAQYIPGDNVITPWKDYPARFVPGSNGRKGIFVSFGGVIEDLNLVPLTDCIALLRASSSWTKEDDNTIRQWYRDYTCWLLTHQHGLDEAACRNNHASWYWADILCFLNFIGEPDRARAYAARAVPERLEIQIEPDGSQPEELVRAISRSYTAFTLISFANIARSSQDAGFDAWSFVTSDGRSITRGLDWYLPYLMGEKEWTWPQVKPHDDSRVVGAYALGAQGSGQAKYREALGRLPALAVDDRNRLLYDLEPLDKR
jgi:hypothetical protein